MMFLWLISGASFLVLVNPHPLVQNIQPFLIPNYQNAYLPPYSEAFVVQPSNFNHCSQPIPAQTPTATYQTLQTPSLKEITQMYWEKLLSDPSVRNILDSNKVCDQYGKVGQTNPQPYNTGSVVNNYIILPPDYVNLNETAETPKTTQVKNESKRPVKQNVEVKERKTKLTNNNDDTIDLKSTKTSHKIKQNPEKSWSFNTQNIKCFKPVDVLKNENYQPEKNVKKNKGATKQCHKENTKRNQNSTNNCENKDKLQKSRKTKTNKFKNKSMENNINECKKIKENKTKQRKAASNMCKCEKTEKILSDKTKTVENVQKCCERDIDDLLLSTLLQQGCADLENRCTRNSKTDTTKTDLRSMYPNLPGDISNSFNWYLNDLYLPQSLQQALNSNAFQGNKYPFDYSQIYQIPQYSNTDIKKSKGNTEKNTRRKKKKKKNSKTKTGKDSVTNSDDINSQNCNTEKKNQIPETSTQIPEINNEILKISTQTFETSTQTYGTTTTKINSQISQKLNHTNVESIVEVNSMSNKIKPSDLPPTSFEKISTESMRITSITSVDKQDSGKTLDDEILKITNDNAEREEESNELYETQIPHSVIVYTISENNTEVPEVEESASDEMLPILGFDIFNQHHGFGSEDEIFNMFMKDYYPDFRADNHAYLVTDDEIDVHNIHDRYYYVTDKNTDSREIYSPGNVRQLSDNEAIYDDNLGNLISEYDDNKNKDNEKEKEIVFRTPPGLDVPDFITRKINRDSKDSTELFYQHNNVDDFDRLNLNNFDDNSDSSDKTAHRNDNSGQIVETVYAKSKVVKYGQGQEVSKSRSEPKTGLASDGTIQNDGRTTVVLAKSLRPGDFW